MAGDGETMKHPIKVVLFSLLLIAFPLAAAPVADDDKATSEGEHQKDEHQAEHEGHRAEHEGHRAEHEGHHEDEHAHGSRFSDQAIPLQLEGFPERPKPILELGEPFLGTGTLDPGFRLPTGAVWQPSLLAFGTLRTAIQTFEADLAGDSRITELATRLDLFFNLQLSGSERLVVGFRTFDEGGRFTSYFFEHPDPALDGEFRDELDAEIESLFFEGDFGEIFPNLDTEDFGSTDIGFSVGRQPLLFQEGLLIDDSIDGIGLTRNTLLPKGTSNFRVTFFYGWDNVNAGAVERNAKVFALLSSTDFRLSTVDIDVAYVDADDATGGLVAAGISAVQRLGLTNSSFRLLGSMATDDETPWSTDGFLLFSELSWTPHHTHDLLYVNTFLAIDEYSAAARGPAVGGPLGRAGINFAAVGLGSFAAPLSSRASDVAGGAIGYQKFFDHTRQQVIVEAGARVGTSSLIEDAYAATVRYQKALGQHFVAVVDGFGSHQTDSDRTLWGGRLELVLKF